MSTIEEKRIQVARQHRAVAHLATQMAMLSFDCAEMILSGHHDPIVQIQGEISARWMEALGDMLNGVDAVDDQSIQWMTPIFERAHELFRASRNPPMPNEMGQPASSPVAPPSTPKESHDDQG